MLLFDQPKDSFLHKHLLLLFKAGISATETILLSVLKIYDIMKRLLYKWYIVVIIIIIIIVTIIAMIIVMVISLFGTG